MSKSTPNGFGYSYNEYFNRKTYRLECFTFILIVYCVYCFFAVFIVNVQMLVLIFINLNPEAKLKERRVFTGLKKDNLT